ncbi:IS3 family transposase [Brevibacillus centrosporus]|uniref:IS3 family transposase n=1 Tax=Brevibacillus centrosporus TaxID=54910 RepID=UPI00398744E1
MTMPQWRASSRITRQKRSIHMIFDLLRKHIGEYIHFYNNSRPQRKLNKLTPVQYRSQLVG